jgi:16S rRNA (cytosine967-C5)-methyltransferase
VRSLLRLSFYQLYYLERIPDHAAVNEAVNIAKKKGHQGISGMVNGVLRNVIRQKNALTVPETADRVTRIALQHSHPEWLVSRWIAQYGQETTERICAANNTPPRVSIRTNTMRRSRDELLKELRLEGIDAAPSPLAPAGIVVTNAGNMALHPKFQRGDFSIQDESSMLVAEFVDPKPGMSVLDCCAAPGGKTAHLAEKMGDRGKIVACDIHEHKKKLIDHQARRLGLASIHTMVADARELAGRFPPASFDRVLLDAPCSGFGVIRRKPEIKWSKRESDIADICSVQRDILSQVKSLVKPGGLLVYSTCTIERAENDGMIRAFLEENPEFEPDCVTASVLPGLTGRAEVPLLSENGLVHIFPHQFGTDGFFIAKLKRRL